MNDVVWFPDFFALHEAYLDRDVAQDEGRGASPAMPHEIGSEDIDAVRRAVSRWEDKCAAAEGAFAAANTVDASWAELTRAEAAFNAAVAVLHALESHLEELEGASELAERREQRSDYFSAVL